MFSQREECLSEYEKKLFLKCKDVIIIEESLFYKGVKINNYNLQGHREGLWMMSDRKITFLVYDIDYVQTEKCDVVNKTIPLLDTKIYIGVFQNGIPQGWFKGYTTNGKLRFKRYYEKGELRKAFYFDTYGRKIYQIERRKEYKCVEFEYFQGRILKYIDFGSLLLNDSF